MIYDNVKKVCKEKGMTVSELEESMGIARSTIYKWNENIPSAQRLQIAANILGVPITELLKE